MPPIPSSARIPTNPRVDYAYYMKGLVYFERQSNWLERKFNVDLSQRPPVNARKSFEAFQQLIEKYPHSEYVGDSRQRMIFLRNRLADFELHVALYYMRRGAYVGALNRAKYCVENYDGAPAVKGSMKVLVDAYRELAHGGSGVQRREGVCRELPRRHQGHHSQETLVGDFASATCSRW